MIIQQDDRLIGKADAFFMKETEKCSQIDRVSEPGKRTGRYSDRPEEIRAGLWELFCDLTDLKDPFCIDLFSVLIDTLSHFRTFSVVSVSGMNRIDGPTIRKTMV